MPTLGIHYGKATFSFATWGFVNILFLLQVSPTDFSEHLLNLHNVNIIMITNSSLIAPLFHLYILISILHWRGDIFLFN